MLKGAPAGENPLWPVHHTGVVGGPRCRAPTRVPKGDLLARSLGFHAMLSEQAVERLPIYSSCLRGPGDVARVAIERASQIRSGTTRATAEVLRAGRFCNGNAHSVAEARHCM